MDGIRQSITAHNAAIAAHLQAQQHQVHAQAQHQAAAAAAAQQHRNSSFAWHNQQAAVPNNSTAANAAQIQNGYSNFMPSMLALQSSMAQMAMVATAKLAPFRKTGATNSNLAVRTTVPRLNVAGGIYTVAQWARKCVEDNIEFVVKIVRRNDPKADLVMLAYGDGCQTLVFFDDAMNKVPKNFSKIKKIHVGVSTAPIDDKRTGSEMAESGVLQPIDSLWDHLRYEQANATKDKKEKIMFIHTSMTVYGDSDIGRRRVLQIKTNAPKSPLVAKSYIRNVMFEREVLAKWKGEVPGVTPVLPEYPVGAAGVTLIAPAVNPLEAIEENEYLITFNPKELLLLEKAFDNALTPRDRKSKAEKWTDDDQKKCQLTIRRAQNEFKYVFPRKPNRKKPEDTPTSTKKSVPQTASKSNDTKKGKPSKDIPKKAKMSSIGKKKDNGPALKKKANVSALKKKSATKLEKKEKPVDSDDEPIVKLKTPAKKAKSKTTTPKKNPPKKEIKKVETTSKKGTPAKKANTEGKGVIVKKSATKKRGREKNAGQSPKKTRSRSSSKSRTVKSSK